MNPLLRIFDPLARSDEAAPAEYRVRPEARTWQIPVGLGILLLGISVILGVAGSEEGHFLSGRFYFAYLIAFTFCLTVTLGAMFFVMIQHITQAYWSVTVRRIPEILMMSFPLLAILGLPIITLGMHDLYHWTHEGLLEVGGPEYDPIIAGKSSYLNRPFFTIRYIGYFALWIIISYRLYRASIGQDLNGGDTSADQRKTSAWGLLVFALTTAFAGFDFLMTLDPHWFSTMFGVYFFAGAFFVINATVTMYAILLQRGGRLDGVITDEHYHDLGKYMFAFTVFWAYIAFSQYMLIWYGNLPEETLWFRHRIEGSWANLAWVLLFGHFIFPFLIMIFRAIKRIKTAMLVMTIWFLGIHYVDLYWIAMPVYDSHGFHPALVDVTTWLGFIALLAGVTIWRAGRHSAVPYNDRYFAKSVSFVNA